MKAIAIIALTVGSLTAFGASARDAYPTGSSYYGTSVTSPAKGRIIDLAANKPMNVTCGEVVTFVNGAQSFTWKFDGVSHRALDVAKIAPSGFGAAKGTVYINRNITEIS